MQALGWLRALPRAWSWLVELLVATVAFWKLRVIDTGTNSPSSLGSRDIYTDHYPMAK